MNFTTVRPENADIRFIIICHFGHNYNKQNPKTIINVQNPELLFRPG